MTCHRNTLRKFFIHPTAVITHAPQRLCLIYPSGKAVSAKKLSYLGPKTWDTLPAEIKLRKNVNTFKHDIKKLFFEKLQKDTDDIFIYY